MKKTLSIIMIVCMLLSMMPAAFAAGEEQVLTSEAYAYTLDDETLEYFEEVDTITEDAYAASIIDSQGVKDADLAVSAYGLNPDRLSDIQKVLYDGMAENILKIASGEGISSFTLSWSKEKSPIRFKMTENDKTDPSAALDKYWTKVGKDTVYNYLLMNMTYELFWHDKTIGILDTCKAYVVDDYIVVTSVEYVFAVSEDYQAADTAKSVTMGDKERTAYKVKSDKVEQAKTAKTNADEIIEANADKSDYDKLLAYKDAICELVSYDRNADNGAPYGDQWQMIYVFDKDKATNVVCEGYSKAFQYLCDNSRFSNAQCYIATGTLSGSGISGNANHMWNIVELNDSYYLVDITNSDAGTIGQSGGLFMVGAEKDSSDNYTFTINGSTVTYTYNDQTLNDLDNITTLSTTSYSANAAQPTEPESHTHQWGDWTADNDADTHTRRCDGCDETESQNHSWGDGEVTTAPTETEDGVRTYTCEECSAVKTEVVDKLPHTHQWGDWTADDGADTHTRRCDGCDETESQSHSWNDGEVTTAPTETEDGVRTYTCTTCKAQKTEPVSALGVKHEHSYDATKWSSDAYYHWHECSNTGCDISDNSQKDGYGTHTWSDWSEVKAATESDTGTKTRSCTACGKVENVTIPVLTSHNWSSTLSYDSKYHWYDCTDKSCTITDNEKKYGYAEHSFGAYRVTVSPTATTSGQMVHSCTCGYSETVTIPATGSSDSSASHTHSWSSWQFYSPNYWERSCQTCGERDIKVDSSTSSPTATDTPTQPTMTAGTNQSWTKGSTTGLSFTSSAPLSQLKYVRLNGYILTTDFYTATSGSTIITLSKTCMDNLDVGTHTISIESEGGTVQTSFTVKAASSTTTTTTTTSTTAASSTYPWSTPKTGDTSNMTLWICLIVASLAGISAVAFVVYKKSKKNH